MPMCHMMSARGLGALFSPESPARHAWRLVQSSGIERLLSRHCDSSSRPAKSIIPKRY